MLYAAIENGAGGDRLWGLFKTTNGAATWSHVDAGFHGTATFAVADADPGPGTLNLVRVTRVTGPAFHTDGTWTNRRLLSYNDAEWMVSQTLPTAGKIARRKQVDADLPRGGEMIEGKWYPSPRVSA